LYQSSSPTLSCHVMVIIPLPLVAVIGHGIMVGNISC
jgi:hypothetical protein